MKHLCVQAPDLDTSGWLETAGIKSVRDGSCRLQGVRRGVGAQSMDNCRRQGEDKDERVLRLNLSHARESSGTMPWTERLVLIMAHAIGHLEHEREWVSSELSRAACRCGRGVL
jgi:hypothetical protein